MYVFYNKILKNWIHHSKISIITQIQKIQLEEKHF